MDEGFTIIETASPVKETEEGHRVRIGDRVQSVGRRSTRYGRVVGVGRETREDGLTLDTATVQWDRQSKTFSLLYIDPDGQHLQDRSGVRVAWVPSAAPSKP
jgi:hypothetical protein